MIFRAHHIEEELLFECYLAEKDGEPIDPPAAEHLADCARCGARYADLQRFMDGLRSDAEHDLDEAFPHDRLRAQQQQIARRIEHIGHPARVISFPRQAPDAHAAASRSRIAPRWLAGAAAAGLVLGVSLGSALYQGSTPVEQAGAPTISTNVSNAAGPLEAPAVPARALEQANGVDFLSELELSELEIALERPYTPELVALDELTPHVREVRISRISR